MVSFYGDELLALRANSKQGVYLLSAVREFLFNTYAATLNIGGHSSTRRRVIINIILKITLWRLKTHIYIYVIPHS